MGDPMPQLGVGDRLLVSAMLTAPPSISRMWNSSSPSGRGAFAIE